MREALSDTAGVEITSQNLNIIEGLAPVIPLEILPVATDLDAEETGEEIDEPPPEFQRVTPEEDALPARVTRRRLVAMVAAIGALVVLLAGAVAIVVVAGIGGNGNEGSHLSVSWEFGDAWNTLDNEQWTQQITIVVEDEIDDLTYTVNGEPSGAAFERVLSICDGDGGTIRAESSDGRSGTVVYEFESPYCP
jgi:hypothetical protein